MGILLIFIGGLIGAGTTIKKTFTACWMFLINLAFALYISIFLAPLVVSLLDIPGLADGYKNAIALGGLFLISDIILRKITEQIIPNPENESSLPKFAKIFSILAGFLSGVMIVGILLYCFMQTPFVNGLSVKKEFRSTSRKTLMGVVHVVNALSFQSLTQEAERDLQSIRLLPKKKNDKDNKIKDRKQKPKNKSAAEKKSTKGSEKKQSAKPEKTIPNKEAAADAKTDKSAKAPAAQKSDNAAKAAADTKSNGSAAKSDNADDE